MQNKGSLHNKFEGFGSQPSEKLWDSIASNLDQKKKRRAIIFWWLGTGLAAGIIVLLGSRFINSENDLNTVQIVHETKRLDKQLGSDKEVAVAEDNIESGNPVENVADKTLLTNTNNYNNGTVNLGEINLNPTTNEAQKKNRLTTNKASSGMDESNQKSLLSVDTIKINKFDIAALHVLPEERNRKLSFNEISMPITKSPWVYSFKIQSQKGFLLFNETEPNLAGTTSNNSMADIELIPSLYAKKTIRPLALRFGVAKQLKKRLSFQTGIDVGWIQTKDISTQASLFTIGVPLKLNLTLIEIKKAAFYTDFGLVNEFPIFELKQYFGGGGYNSISSNFVTGFFGGTELGIGFNYKINEKLKFDLNSGFKWYYYQGAKNVTSLVKQNALVTINAGIIWNY